VKSAFARFAHWTSEHLGSAPFFLVNVVLTLGWAAAWAARGWDDWWQFVCTTVLTITTWLLLILVQHTQNRDTKAMQKKLDALVSANDRISNALVGIEWKDGEA
jgi:low affinity Fe/Cu permease